jgi:hypothetical protein
VDGVAAFGGDVLDGAVVGVVGVAALTSEKVTVPSTVSPSSEITA